MVIQCLNGKYIQNKHIGRGYTVLPLSVRPSVLQCFRPSDHPSFRPSSVHDICRRIFLSNCWRQKSDIWSQASYRYTILWVAFLDPSDSYFLFADLVGLYRHWTYMNIFRHLFLSNHWWQRSDIWSQASYRYPISWEVFLDPSNSYILFADLVGFLYTLNIYAHFSSHFSQQLLIAEIWYLVTSFI